MATVTDIKEHKDGSATVTFDLEPVEVTLLLGDAIIRAIKAGIEAEKRRVEEFEDE